MQYLRLTDAKARLDRNLIQIHGEPFYVEFVDQGPNDSMVAVGFKLSDRKTLQVVLNQEYIAPPKFRMGYTNYWKQKEPTAVYLERIPRRHTALGITRENSTVVAAKVTMEDGNRRPDWSAVFVGQPFLDLQNGVYPPLKTALGFSTCALSPEFAVVRTALKVHTFMYMNEAIGEFYAHDMSIVLYPPYLYAKEEVERFFKSRGETINVLVHQ